MYGDARKKEVVVVVLRQSTTNPTKRKHIKICLTIPMDKIDVDDANDGAPNLRRVADDDLLHVCTHYYCAIIIVAWYIIIS